MIRIMYVVVEFDDDIRCNVCAFERRDDAAAFIESEAENYLSLYIEELQVYS